MISTATPSQPMGVPRNDKRVAAGRVVKYANKRPAPSHTIERTTALPPGSSVIFDVLRIEGSDSFASYAGARLAVSR